MSEAPEAPQVLLAHPGNGHHVRQTVRALDDREMLDAFVTTFVDHPGSALARGLRRAARLAGPAFTRELSRRAFPEAPASKLITYPGWEFVRTAAHRLVQNPVLTDAIWAKGEVRFTQFAASQVGTSTDVAYGYEHAALELLQAARRRGILAIYEQPSPHYTAFEAMWETLKREHPESVTRAAESIRSPPKQQRRRMRLDAELAAADRVFCNSSFTRSTLLAGGVDDAKIVVTPLGFPAVDLAPRDTTGGVQFLNAGNQSFVKGLHLLYRAWRRLAPAESEGQLWLIGDQSLPEPLRRDLPGRVTFQGRVPHDSLMEHYHQADVFVLPTLADGFGMVITEAMSRGVPVLATTNSAAPDLIEHGVNGWIIPPNDVDALEAQMRWCIENREQLPAIGRRAAEAAERWQWADYRRALTGKIADAARVHQGEGLAG